MCWENVGASQGFVCDGMKVQKEEKKGLEKIREQGEEGSGNEHEAA